VHDEDQISSIGDLVQIKESRPISKTKSWVLLNIIKKAVVENIG
jgi:small subunit ribosomal protein S17